MTTGAPDILICIPTYNERDNVKTTCEQALAALSECHILVVDDSSPDGTGDVVRRLSAEDPRIHLLTRAVREGMGRAYAAAFDWGLARSYRFFIQFDADGSHRAAHLPAIVDALGRVPFVTGSRQVKGGGSEHWSIRRRWLSAAGNGYARALLRLPVLDLTGGFNGIRREVLETVDYRNLRASGYAFQIELKAMVCRAGFAMEETPIIFSPRRSGSSKMSLAIIAEAILTVLRLHRERCTCPPPFRRRAPRP